MNETKTLEARLAGALGAPLEGAELARLDARVATALRLDPRRGHRRAIGRKPVLVIAGLLVVALGAVASGALRSTESPFGLESAANFQAEIDAAKAVVPIPAGANWPSSLDVTDASGSYSAAGGRAMVENVAFCLWTTAWISASEDGDAASAARSLNVLRDSRSWTSYSGTFSDRSYRDIVDGIVAGAAAGNSQPAKRFVSVNCGGL